METGNEIIVEADVHDQAGQTGTGTRRSARNVQTGTSAPVQTPPPPKKRGPKKKDSNASSGKRMTVNALASIVSDMQRAGDARADTMEREIRSNNAVLKGLGDALERLASSLPANNNVIVRPNVTTPQVTTPAPVPATLDVAQQPPPPTVPVQSHPIPPTTPAVQPSAALPPPQELVRDANAGGCLDRMIAKEDYKSTSNHGKSHFNYNELGMAKPFMFIYREGLQTPKQKLDIRATLSMIEYVNATVLLLQDNDAYNKDDLLHILAHLAAVTTDAMVRPWSAVRAWSQYIWDCVERRKCTWTSYQFIQDERVRMSFISGAPSGNSASNNATNKSVSHDIKVVLCREYNSVSGCRFHGTHEEHNVKYLHACSHCDAMGRRSSHSYMRCRAKMDAGSHNSHGSYENRQWQHSNARQHNNGQGSDNQYTGQAAYRNGPSGQAYGTSKNA